MSNKGEGRARAAPEGTDWKSIGRKLVTWTRFHHRRTLEDAKEIAQEAIRRFFDPDYVQYDPAVHGSVLWFLGSIVNGIVANERRRSVSSRSFVALVEDDDEDLSPERRAIADEHADLVMPKVLERTRRDPIVHKLLLAMLEGVEGLDEMAAIVGVPVMEIEKARKRLRAHIEAVTNSLGEN